MPPAVRRGVGFRGRRWLLVSLGLILVTMTPGPARAATPWERTAYEVVQKLFEDGIYELASREAADFLLRYPGSDRVPEATLILAQACLRLGRYDDAAKVLQDHRSQAGEKADEFVFWLAEARFQQRDLPGAARGFAEVNASFPESSRRFEACFREAFACSEGGNFATAVERLQAADGSYQRLRQQAPDDDWILRCGLLLAESLWRQGNYAAAEQTLDGLADRALPAGLEWQRQYLLANVKLAAQRPEEALAHTTNFWTVATNVVRTDLLADAAMLEGRIEEELKDPVAAISAYERNLADSLPADRRQAALQRLIDVGLNAGRKDETAARLEQFIQQHPKDQLLDLARLTLGELRFEAFQAGKTAGAPDTNLLEQARSQFARLTADTPQSPLAGRAALKLGWCLWDSQPPRFAEAADAFQAATGRLPRGLSQVEARLKWADSQFRVGDFRGAGGNYWVVATNHVDVPDLTTNTVIQALHQVVQCGVGLGDLAGASAGLARLQEVDPDSELTQRAGLLLGHAFERMGNAEASQAVFTDFIRRHTNSVWLPEARLGLARAEERAQNWEVAIRAYGGWLQQYTNVAGVPTNLVSQAVFDLARLTLQSTPGTNGVQLLSRFTTEFPNDANVPLAQYLLGEHFFRQGDYGKAELMFLFLDRSLSQPDPGRLGELPYRARLMAGKAAVARQNFRNARDHFDWVITNGPLYRTESPVPAAVAAEAYMLRGDTFLSEDRTDQPDPLYSFGEAINAYTKVTRLAEVTQLAPTNEIVALARARIGDCNFQLAAQDPRRYEDAAEAYRQVMSSMAGVSVRSQAEIGLAIVLERRAQAPQMPERVQTELQDEALGHHLEVFYKRNLREGELEDPYWVKQAGLEAIKLAGRLQRTDLAIGICQRMIRELPPLRASMEKQIEQLRAARPPESSAESPPAPAGG